MNIDYMYIGLTVIATLFFIMGIIINAIQKSYIKKFSMEQGMSNNIVQNSIQSQVSKENIILKEEQIRKVEKPEIINSHIVEEFLEEN